MLDARSPDFFRVNPQEKPIGLPGSECILSRSVKYSQVYDAQMQWIPPGTLHQRNLHLNLEPSKLPKLSQAAADLGSQCNHVEHFPL